MSLFSQLGFAYSRDWFTGAMLLHRGDACTVDHVDEETGDTTLIVRQGDTGTERRVSHEEFPDFNAFTFPTLGYRYVPEKHSLLYITRRNSVRRGLHVHDTVLNPHIAAIAMEEHVPVENTWRWINHEPNWRVPTIMLPKYIPFRKGLADVLEGKIPFFAMSPEFAERPNPDTEGALDILYRLNRIGSISDEGKITMNLQNAQIADLWNKEENRG